MRPICRVLTYTIPFGLASAFGGFCGSAAGMPVMGASGYPSAPALSAGIITGGVSHASQFERRAGRNDSL
jgi:hypothetical protein